MTYGVVFVIDFYRCASSRAGLTAVRGSFTERLLACCLHRAVWRGRVFSFSCSESRLVALQTDCIFSFFSELPVQTKTAANESFTNINEALNSQVFFCRVFVDLVLRLPCCGGGRGAWRSLVFDWLTLRSSWRVLFLYALVSWKLTDFIYSPWKIKAAVWLVPLLSLRLWNLRFHRFQNDFSQFFTSEPISSFLSWTGSWQYLIFKLCKALLFVCWNKSNSACVRWNLLWTTMVRSSGQAKAHVVTDFITIYHWSCDLWLWPCVCLFRPDGMGTVTVEEKEKFQAVRSRLMALLENHITYFR